MTTTLVYSDSSTPTSIAPSPGLMISVTQHAALTNPNVDLHATRARDISSRSASVSARADRVRAGGEIPPFLFTT
ncbi:hypothetical protein PQR28_31065 [Paraburkholderia sediminicola]|uniref:hypothetical protein n=1 Tax=Paraburkholderia sediminicola TaxID=458836 RepID=UPI0038B97966